MRNALLLLFVLVCSAVVSLDHYTLNKNVEFQQASEQYYVNALRQVYEVAGDLDDAHRNQLDIRRMQHTQNELNTQYTEYLTELTTVLKAQQNESLRLNGIIDDLSNKFAEKCEEFGKLRLGCQSLYQHLQLAVEYINQANKTLRANKLPLPEVKYDGKKLFGEPTPAKKDKST